MDVDELARIEETLLTAIAEAKAVLKATGVGPQFRQIFATRARCTTSCLRRYAPTGK